MYDEYNALVKNGTWLLVPRLAGVNMVRSIWLFKHKFHADRTLSRYKARLVANCSSQQLDVDFDETFSPVIKPTTIRMVLSLVPPGIVNNRYPHHVCILQRSLYGLLTSADYRGLQYLTFTRPDLSYAVQQICLYMHDSREPHLAALKRILRYVQGTLDLSLHLYASSTTSLVGYIDADWAGCPSTRWSTSETAWLCNLLRELHSPLSTATLVYCDNVSVVYMSANPVQHQRTKHIEIDIHFVRDMVTAGQVRVLHVPSRFQYVDIFTKGLPSALFEEFRSSLSVRHPPAPTTAAY
uniref:Ribonuclease H-like domain-containing protein n=1 Tax=Tanacetum cinerariifolium TaxID=118510 RepID=A0A6L2M8W8_TANCI|nr:ribonuclease H-like domain-containing protein [Tanacetum cinerariifolium]